MSLGGERNCYEVTNCILDHASETSKINWASAGVLLGLLPGLLGLLGSSTIETSCLAVRRPILGLLLCLGSPAVNPIRVFDYRDTVEKITKLDETIGLPTMPGGLRSLRATLVLKYILTLGAIANITTVNLQLGRETINNNACRVIYLPLLYGIFAVLTHALGFIAFSRRVHVQSVGSTQPTHRFLSFTRHLKQEFTDEKQAEKSEIYLRKGSLSFILWSGLTTLVTLFHVIAGIFIFSSVLFIYTNDAIVVIARYLASVIVCRGVLLHELASFEEAFAFKLS